MTTIEEAFKAKIEALATAAETRVFREVIEQEPVITAISFVRTGGTPYRRNVETGIPVLRRAAL